MTERRSQALLKWLVGIIGALLVASVTGGGSYVLSIERRAVETATKVDGVESRLDRIEAKLDRLLERPVPDR